ncbi:MAG: hypothetical protein ACOCVA_01280, partial [Prolixibacteraceae bacterium]
QNKEKTVACKIQTDYFQFSGLSVKSISAVRSFTDGISGNGSLGICSYQKYCIFYRYSGFS